MKFGPVKIHISNNTLMKFHDIWNYGCDKMAPEAVLTVLENPKQ